ncbi:MAG: hypothetical protein WAM92_20425 [Mycobacterium sp.]
MAAVSTNSYVRVQATVAGLVNPSAPGWLARMTGRAWLLGLIFGAVAAAAAVAASWLLDIAGVSTVPLGWLMTVKAVYSGVLGFVVARWVILRQLVS